MMQGLQNEIQDWVNPKHFNLDNYYKDFPLGYFSEVDLDMDNDHPLAVKKMKVRNKNLQFINIEN